MYKIKWQVVLFVAREQHESEIGAQNDRFTIIVDKLDKHWVMQKTTS